MISKINDLVQNVLLNKLDRKEFIKTISEYCENEESIDFFNMLKDSAIRLVNIYEKYINDEKYKIDFECSLRNYLLLIKKEVSVVEYDKSNLFEKFGLMFDESKKTISVKYNFPEYINENLVRKVYENNSVINNDIVSKTLYTNEFIYSITGFEKFKSMEQKLAVIGSLRVPEGYTALVSMSTGSGKSLITQTIAYQKEGLTIVIVPTISLMIDQVNNAKQIIKSNVDDEIFYYSSGIEIDNILDAINNKKAKLLFLSPESVTRNRKLKESIIQANNSGYLKNIIVDEAHIVIEWGGFFRVDFQCIDAFRKELLDTNPNIRTFLLSATYSKYAVEQLKKFYSENDKWIEIRCDKLRHGIVYDVIKAKNTSDKKKKILELVEILPHPMIIYVNSPKEAEELKKNLFEEGFYNVFSFSGETSNSLRESIISKWKANDFEIIVATCAFGVGVDKKDVRTVLHTYIPESTNRYYQEAGRGGRDDRYSLSCVVYEEKDIDISFGLVDKVITTKKLHGRWFSMLNSSNSMSLMNSRYMIDTFVKPIYNESDYYIDSINNQDVTWNVYVILLLRRHNLLRIDKVDYIDGTYYFFITVLDKKILIDNENALEILDEVRNLEWERNFKEFKIVKNALKHVGNDCWSSMFNKIYIYTDEYCAGCNSHNTIINFEDGKVLKDDIEKPLKDVSDKIMDFLYGASQCLVLYNDEKMITNYMIQLGVDAVVVSEKESYELSVLHEIGNSYVTIYSYDEYRTLCEKNGFYISGSICIFFPDDEEWQKIMLRLIESNNGNKYIICSKNDSYLSFRGKKLNEIIQGPCKKIYI